MKRDKFDALVRHLKGLTSYPTFDDMIKAMSIDETLRSLACIDEYDMRLTIYLVDRWGPGYALDLLAASKCNQACEATLCDCACEPPAVTDTPPVTSPPVVVTPGTPPELPPPSPPPPGGDACPVQLPAHETYTGGKTDVY